MRLAVIHGPNLNLLGTRQPDIYGSQTLKDVGDLLDAEAKKLGVTIDHFQSNGEGALVDYIQGLKPQFAGAVLNVGAYTHTSIAIRDALLAIELPFVEVHLSNTHAREPFRHHSYLSDIAVGVVAGFGIESYRLGFRGLVAHLQR